MEYSSYRDGGTMSIRNSAFKYICKSEIDEVCVDGRIGTKTPGQMTLGYPDNEISRLLTTEEKLEIIPLINEGLEADLNWRTAYQNKFEELTRTPEQIEIDEVNGLMDSWNYYFEVGDKVRLHPKSPKIHSEFMVPGQKDISHLFDKIGVVKDCSSDCHAFGQGSLYFVTVDFDGEKIRNMAGNFIKAEE